MKFLSTKVLSVLGMIVALATSGCDSANSINDAAGSGDKRTSGSSTIVAEEPCDRSGYGRADEAGVT